MANAINVNIEIGQPIQEPPLPVGIDKMSVFEIAAELWRIDEPKLRSMEGMRLDPQCVQRLRRLTRRHRQRLLDAGVGEWRVDVVAEAYFEMLEFEPGRSIAAVERYWRELEA